LFCVKNVKTENWQKFKTIILKVNAKTIMKNEYVTNVHGFNPKPAGSVDKATQLGNRMTLHKIIKRPMKRESRQHSID
jgi:hypothetical protein